MATPSHARAVKSLNQSPGRRRFVFKTFSERIEEIEIDVYRSLDKIKPEPSEGSSFIRDCLVEWRELNTAEDFISFYEEMMPFVQTLPLVLLHKELIFSKLVSRLQMKARLSIEPIMRLIAALSRDLLEDFILFLPRFVDSLVFLLKSGADKEPEIIEQVFTSLSSILMYLQKFLVRDIVHVLKLTIKLRYYAKGYVQDFVAMTISFLLRNAPKEQLVKGIRKIIFEVVKKPVAIRKSGVSSLLYFVMRGTSSRFHSKAERVLLLLTDNSLFTIGDDFEEGSDTVVEVVITTFQRLCEELETKELNLMLNCLYQKIDDCVANEDLLHLSHLLSLLTSIMQVNNRHKVSDYQLMVERVGSLVQKFIVPSDVAKGVDHLSRLIDKVLKLMLCILDGLNSIRGMSTIAHCSLQWAAVFELRNSRCLNFISQLLEKDPQVVYAFRVNILRMMSDLIETSQGEVVCLLLSFCGNLQKEPLSSSFLDGASEEVSKIHGFMQEAICSWIRLINDVILSNASSPIDEAKLAMLWGIICCYPYFMGVQANASLLMSFIDAVDKLLKIEAENIAGVHKYTWQSLIGAALSSYYKCCKNSRLEETGKILRLAKTYKSSFHVLSAVADYLDYVHGPTLEADTSNKSYHPEFEAKNAVDTVGIFTDNLNNPDKGIRCATLRILCHYEPVDSNDTKVLQLLFMIETAPLSISTSRKIILLISKIQMGLSAGRISQAYVPIILSGIIGIFYNRFSYLWNPASECLAILIDKNVTLVWDKFVHYFEHCQSLIQTSHDKLDEGNADLSDNSHDLVEQFNLFVTAYHDGTPYTTVLSSMLQSLQKIPSVAESRSRQIVPLFLKFLGYNNDDVLSMGSFDSNACKGKEWKGNLKEWLNLFKLMRNPKAFYRSQFVKDVMQIRLVDDNDAEVQLKVLDCLLNWKDDFLLPYEHHLRNLISAKNLREELTTWVLSRDSSLIEEGHRRNLVPLVLLLLMPKVRKLKTLSSRKHTSVHHRKAVLRFISQLDVSEISLFFILLFKPLQIMPKGDDGAIDFFWTLPKSSMDDVRPLSILKYFTMEKIMALSWKKRYAFLHVIEDILRVFDELHIRPFLDLLMGGVVRILASCTASLDFAKGIGSSVVEDHFNNDLKLQEKDGAAVNHALTSTAVKQFKDLRSLCLKIVSFVLNKYDDHDFGSEFWDMFFASVKPLIDSFKQEGSSSEKPSSLFSCFLAMSGSYHLVPLLSREKNLVGDVFSILTVTTASEAIISSVLKFIENLLNLDEELENEENVAKGVIIPNLDELISSLDSLFQIDGANKRKLAKLPGDVRIGIFKLLSKYIKDQLSARKFVDILLPILAIKDSDVCVECLQVIQEIVPVLGDGSTTKILKAVSPLLIYAELNVRLCICKLLKALVGMDSSVSMVDQTDPSMSLVAKLVCELNATSGMEMGGLDYDIIFSAYAKIDVGFFRTMQEHHALVVLSHCVYDMSSDELILRHSAYRSLLSFVEFSAVILCGEEKNDCEKHPALVTSDEGYWTRSCIERVITKFLLKHMGNAMKSGGSVRKEWIELLRDMVLKLPEVANLNSFRALCSDDSEQDFFNNITHLQKHRRAKALSRFRNTIRKNKMPEGIINKVFLPLFFHMLLDVQDGKGEHIKTACMEAITSISARMGWKSYYALLLRCFREMNMNLDKKKLILRLICSILDEFHFSNSCSSQFIEGAPNNLNVGTDTGNSSFVLQSGTSSLTMLHKGGDSAISAEIQMCMHKTVFPKLQKLLNSDADKVNVNISVAAMKVLKLLPGDIMDSQLPSIIHRIANHLKNRLESIRDEARLALAACLKELGLEYLQFVVGILRATLKRGYELHVLGYSLNFILAKSLSAPVIEKLDYCLDDLLSVVENDILGDVAEEKEVEKIASKMKETKKCKSFETLKLISQSVTFKSHALKLLSPITAHMQKHVTPKMKIKLETMLCHIAAGIECNPSVDQTDLFIFIYGLIEDGINEETGQCEDSARTVIKHSEHGAIQKTTSSQIVGTRSACSHLITVFALGLFQNHMKNMKLYKSNEQLLSMLDPFIKLLGNCLSSKYEDILSASLRCLTPLLGLPLPSLASQADKIKVTLLDIAQNSVNANSPLMQSCLKLLAVLLQSTKVTFSSDQLHLLIQFPLFADLERNPSLIALSLLKAIIKRKLVVHEIYDVAIRVAELMVTSQMETIRKKCSRILLQFLRDYHISGKYLQQHLDFLLKNLSYEHSTGREAVLDMLHVIIIKFPKSLLDKHAHILFIHMVQRLANDTDNKVRLSIGVVIKLLIGRMSPHLLDSILDFSLSWYMDEKRQFRSLGAQATGLLVEVMNKSFEKHIKSILPVTRDTLQSAVIAVGEKQQELHSDETVPFWKDAYYTLVMLEKILCNFHDLIFYKDLEDIWEAICELLLHPHLWLRNISNRLVGFYFATATDTCCKNHEITLGAFFLMRPSKLFHIAVSLCSQLKTQVIDDAASKLIIQNLVSAISNLHSLMGTTECIDPCKYWSTLKQHEQGQFLHAFQLLDSRKGQVMFLNVVSGVGDENDVERPENLQHLLVSNLLKTMGKMALQMEAIQMKIVFTCYQKISSKINQDDCQRYAFDMLLPLYKVSEGFAGKVISDDLKQLAQEVLESIRNAIGIQNFVQLYSEIRKKLKIKRDKRKQEEKVMAVVNPMRNAKRKLRIAAKHRAHKKRKLMTMKFERWMH